MKKPPKVVAVFPSLPRDDRYPLQEFKLRTIQYENSPKLIDIREFVTSTTFSGFSPKGLSLTLDQWKHLLKYGEQITKSMEEVNNGTQVQSESQTP